MTDTHVPKTKPALLATTFIELLKLEPEEFQMIMHLALGYSREEDGLEFQDTLQFYDTASKKTSMWRDILSYERRHALLDASLYSANAAASGRRIGVSKQRSHDMIVRAKEERLRRIEATDAIGI